MAGRTKTFYANTGDTGIALRLQLQEPDGKPASLPPGTTVVFRMGMPGEARKVDAAAVIDADQTANPGWVAYSWTLADLNQANVFDAEFVVTRPAGVVTYPRGTYELKIDIKAAI